MVRKYRFIAFLIVVSAILISSSDSFAISIPLSFSQLAEESDYVIVGKVLERRGLYKDETGPQGELIEEKLEGGLYLIEVKEVLFAKDPSWEKRKTIFIYNPEKYPLEEALPQINKTNLYFLQVHSFDPLFADLYKLKEDVYFEIYMGRQGQIDVSNKGALKEIREILSQKKENCSGSSECPNEGKP